MTASPLVFLDTETTGLTLDDDIWEFAAIRRESDGIEVTLHMFIEHDDKKCVTLPESFRADHLRRFPSHNQTESQEGAARRIANFLHVPYKDPKPHIVGAVPNFDTERLALLLGKIGQSPPWHYHLIDVENLAVGYLANEPAPGVTRDLIMPPWESDDLSRACGVEPPGEGERHTALGDARWAMRLYDVICGNGDAP